MHQEGWKFVAVFAAATALFSTFSPTLFWIGIVLTLWCAYFFRDPVRTVPGRAGLVVSPADGLVQKIVKIVPPAQLDLGTNKRTRISIFLNVFDVHVNRIPIRGTVTLLHYHPGAFLNASLDKASEENERQHVIITMGDGRTLGVVQIAGFIARRILCTLKEGQTVATGERFGLIRFGSRVDLWLPEGIEPLVVEGQYAIGGETVLADLQATEPARTGDKI
jgi:phosphatidylserine decarboxylase